MPSESGAQHRAMEAAAHGHSTIGIPKSVGKEYVAADKAKGGDGHAGRVKGAMRESERDNHEGHHHR